MTTLRFDTLDKLAPSETVKIPALDGETRGHVIASDLKGQKGDAGDAGIQGDKGDTGDTGLSAPSSAGFVFSDNDERDSYAAWEGLISIQIDSDNVTQYQSSGWVAYTGVNPFYFVGYLTASDVDGHLSNGTIYEEINS